MMIAKEKFVTMAIITSLIIGYTLEIPEWAFLPPLARGLSRNNREARTAYEARIVQEFPVGMKERDLIARLEKEGFKRNQRFSMFSYLLYENKLGFVISGFACTREYAVAWSSKNEVIVRVKGDYTLSCL